MLIKTQRTMPQRGWILLYVNCIFLIMKKIVAIAEGEEAS